MKDNLETVTQADLVCQAGTDLGVPPDIRPKSISYLADRWKSQSQPKSRSCFPRTLRRPEKFCPNTRIYIRSSRLRLFLRCGQVPIKVSFSATTPKMPQPSCPIHPIVLRCHPTSPKPMPRIHLKTENLHLSTQPPDSNSLS